MKKYWFYGIMPIDSIDEISLTEEQKNIIRFEDDKINSENYHLGWIGFARDGTWEFMRNGIESITIEEEKGNVAREILFEVLKQKYSSN